MAVIAKNLVKQPRFIEVTDETGWFGLAKFGGSNLQAPATKLTPEPDPTQTGNACTVYLTGMTYESPLFRPIGNIEPGTYYLWIRYRDGSNKSLAPGRFGIVPIDNTDSVPAPIWDDANYLPGEYDKYLKPLEKPAAEYINKSATIEIPDMGGWEYLNSHGDQLYLSAEHANVEFAIALIGAGTLNLTAVSGARLDEISNYDEPLPGYFDGSMPEADGVTFSWDGEAFRSTSSAADGTAETIVIDPPAAQFSEDPPQFMLPEATGVIWTVNGENYEPGGYQVEPTKDGVTVKIVPVEKFGYTFDPPAEEQEFTWYAADPDPDPDPGPVENWAWPVEGEVTDGGKLVARFLKWSSNDELQQATFYYSVVLAYVWAYTRGKGFDLDMQPNLPLQRVIVAAGARLAYNPESVSRWQVTTESETLTVFNGFNLAEQAVLRRYRRVFA